jgi:hypothetical protein
MLARAAAALSALATLGACDEVLTRAGGVASSTPLQQRAMRALLTPRGVQALMRAELATDGLAVDAAARTVGALQLGPIAQDITVQDLGVGAREDALDLSLDFGDAALLVPVRVGAGAQTRICRWRVQLDEAAASMTLELDPDSPARALRTRDTPAVTSSAARAEAVGACDLGPEAAGRADLEGALLDYADESLAQAARDFGARSLLDDLGALRSTLTLERLSPLDTRAGSVRVSGALSQDEPARLFDQGASFDLAYAIDVPEPAPCAPIPTSLARPLDGVLAPLDGALLTESEADGALLVSAPLLANAARLGVRAGLSCQGLAGLGQARFASPDAIPLDELFLDQLGVDTSIMGSRALILLSPGALPDLRLEPDVGTLRVIWRALHVDLYVEVFGAPVRALRLVSDVTFDFKPRAGSAGALRLDVDAVEVLSPELETEWLAARPDPDALLAWATPFMARQVFGAGIELPLPLGPGARTSRVVRAIVRDNDLALLVRFAEEAP